ncbi:4'-phosphopantetheinyl transferase family protein [Leptospira vanthielii]|uniref:4'-phosphopantetheinyl transferase family protein n=1 Tax=Leptospira vanthielii serovar Holland str. Waz Holland = ATCC 700522 TaxID=1218591 RepID=N1WAC1_9LEPT|nr:4'-phosphopantetheinyl transferase superfamily protein [Leptospira vanthielii]EMY71943.1 4'-phosphopantetheinyl transferase family protein [Leptospira vanthielii serovar Holland str. Waz Holland = ATCC 700522]
MISIYLLEFPNNFEVEHILDFISPEKKVAYGQARIKKYSIQNIFSDALIRYLLIRKLKLSNSEISFWKNLSGKPFLTDGRAYFNLSHSNNQIVCAISEKDQIGIDIEEIIKIEESVFINIFTANELSYLCNFEDDNKTIEFFKIWTAKESFVKADGRGLLLPLKNINVNLHSHSIEFLDNAGIEYWPFKQYLYNKKFVISACCKYASFPDQIYSVDFDEVVNSLVI